MSRAPGRGCHISWVGADVWVIGAVLSWLAGSVIAYLRDGTHPWTLVPAGLALMVIGVVLGLVWPLYFGCSVMWMFFSNPFVVDMGWNVAKRTAELYAPGLDAPPPQPQPTLHRRSARLAQRQ